MKNFLSLVAAASALLLAACGGGAPGAGDEPAADDTGRAFASAAGGGTWTLVANENQPFAVTGTAVVRYGAGSSWVEKTVSASGICSNGFFGADPALGQVKRCEVQAASAAGGWTTLANEGQSFNGAGVVRYGVGSAWIERTVNGAASCSNGYFGADPAFGQVKRCETQAAAGAWALLANENQAFSAAAMVRYGAGNAWVQKSVNGSAICSNAFFGGDPAIGQVKRCETQGVASAPPIAPAAPAAPAPTLGNALSSARVMISGHSLTDDPLGGYMASIAESLNTKMWWNQQIVLGSPMRVRTRGDNLSDPGFSGYRVGKNRGGTTGMNIAAELANPQTLGGERYDTLLLAERHDLGSTLMWEDTVRYARHFHERLIAGNARANSYLYHAWLEVNKNDPSAWINYERAAAPAWQCVAARVNQSLAGEGRSDRMAYLPAGLALTQLVEQATRGGVAGISGSSVRETMDRLFTDDVHLTKTGVYYMALVSYASVYRRSPVGAWAPPEVTAQQARALQDLAWQAVANHYNSAATPSMAQCQAVMREQYCSAFASFKGRDTQAGCIGRFSAQSQDNPFFYNAANDATYWFPAPR